MPKIRKPSPATKTSRFVMDEEGDISGDVTVVDVYDVASEIGKECEKIIDKYGADAVTALMPKVINALELLETLATKNERENTELVELQSKIAQLENDKIEKAEYREKFERELEMIEEQWRSESKELMNLVSRLQEENRRLRKDRQGSGYDSPTPSEAANDGSVMHNLRISLEKQRDEIHLKEKLLQEKCCDIESLKSQVERLTNSSRELKRKHKSMQMQVRNLCDERADFLAQLQDQQRDITALRQRLGLAQKENEDLVKSDVILPHNKVVFDLDDPNRPRFTTAELKDILHERNELKARVSDLEDELETYRPKKACESFLKSKSVETTQKVEHCLPPSEEEDPPVQGPMPYEPDDAPWKRSSESVFGNSFLRAVARAAFLAVVCPLCLRWLCLLLTSNQSRSKARWIDITGNEGAPSICKYQRPFMESPL